MSPAKEILAVIAEAVEALNIDLMLIGAYSRDYWMRTMNITSLARMTIDVDIAC